MEYTSARIRPRVIIHGGAGNIQRSNLDEEHWKLYRHSLLSILRSTQEFLSKPGATALDASVHAVSLLEDDPLFNAGKGAVFNRAGEVELEASVMVSRGFNKRGAACSLVRHVRNPIKLAAEILKRGQEVNGGGAQGHGHLSGTKAEDLAREWGLQTVEPTYFWTKKRWEEHRRGLGETFSGDNAFVEKQEDLLLDLDTDGQRISWSKTDYLPQGTVGAVVMDSTGTLSVATSTGGLTNKLPGRIGDTPTVGAGFWAESWPTSEDKNLQRRQSVTSNLSQSLASLSPFGMFKNCLGDDQEIDETFKRPLNVRAVAMSGTGNGDSFLRTAATRTAAAMCRFGNVPLSTAVTAVAGKGGELQRSAGNRWSKTGEGEGGIIGIELKEDGSSNVVFALNCGGMFRSFYDDNGAERCEVFSDDR